MDDWDIMPGTEMTATQIRLKLSEADLDTPSEVCELLDELVGSGRVTKLSTSMYRWNW